MIIGVGLDLVDIAHFRRLVQRGGVDFYKKILTPVELLELKELSLKAQVNYGAKRYAVKEAFSKACGTGIGSFVGFKDVMVTHDEMGRPILKLSERMQQRLKEKFGNHVQTDVSLSDDKVAGAIVILSRD